MSDIAAIYFCATGNVGHRDWSLCGAIFLIGVTAGIRGAERGFAGVQIGMAKSASAVETWSVVGGITLSSGVAFCRVWLAGIRVLVVRDKTLDIVCFLDVVVLGTVVFVATGAF